MQGARRNDEGGLWINSVLACFTLTVMGVCLAQWTVTLIRICWAETVLFYAMDHTACTHCICVFNLRL